jgi:hypothetical protein
MSYQVEGWLPIPSDKHIGIKPGAPLDPMKDIEE